MPPEAIIAALVSIIGTLLGAIGYLWRLHLEADNKREGERDRREAGLIVERDAWQKRWEGSDARLDRISNAFTAAYQKPAPE